MRHSRCHLTLAGSSLYSCLRLAELKCFESCDTGSVVKIAALLHQLVDRRQVVLETNLIVLPTIDGIAC